MLKLVKDLLLLENLCMLVSGHDTCLRSRSRRWAGEHPGLK